MAPSSPLAATASETRDDTPRRREIDVTAPALAGASTAPIRKSSDSSGECSRTGPATSWAVSRASTSMTRRITSGGALSASLIASASRRRTFSAASTASDSMTSTVIRRY